MNKRRRKTDVCPSNFRFALTPLTILMIFSLSSKVHADAYFNPRFLADDPSAVADLSGFEKGQEVPPGTYRVDLYLNNGFMTTKDINFKAGVDGSGLEPCLNIGMLSAMGVNTLTIPGISVQSSDKCVALTSLIKEATTRFDVGHQRLDITIPQNYMGNRARGYIPPALWDNGITAGLLNYSFSGNNVRSTVTGTNSNYAYLNIQDGLNLGAWRLRDNSTWSYSSGGSNTASQNKWQHVNTYAERDIVPWRSRLTLGDGTTPGDVFDGTGFRGVQLATDDNMLPDSQKGFAPVIHGIARGTAQVSIKQNGYEIYQTTVPPGPFTISDLYAAGNSGDLQVSIKEVDGSSQVFTVPYSSVPVLQREGQIKYALTAGQFRSGSSQQDTPTFSQATAMWGLPAGWTIYGGAQLSDKYRAFNLGSGKNMGDFGAASIDITQAYANLPDDSNRQGQSLRFLYNKSLNTLGTNIQLVGYRYSTQGYFTLADTAYNQMNGYSVVTEDGVIQVSPRYTDYYNLAFNRRGKMQATISQQVGRTSTLYLSGSHQSYWGTSQVDDQIQAGYSSSINDITYTLSYSLTKSAWQQGRDQMVAFNINIPFSHWMRSDSKSAFKNSSLSYSASDDLNGKVTNQAGVYGTLLADNNLSYSVLGGYATGENGSGGSTGSASLAYRSGYGNSNVGYSRSNGYSQLYYGLSGGVLAHADGVTLSQPLNDTVVLVKAPGAGGVSIENQTGVKTDWRGYAVIPYAMDYRDNRIALNTNTLANNVDVDDAVISVVPTHGAVVRASYKSHIGLKVLMTIMHNGKAIPFGAIATANSGQGGNIVADDGLVYMTGLPLKGSITVQWGRGASEKCVAPYTLPAASQLKALTELRVNCR
ncbi:fimbrial biogenesis usher protein [Pantoea ananatis]|uniref:fimbrial biogenesis usher protein n=1 Tax=Pantoea ananas TaxID=553 RepID=UPI000F85BBFA|nr:fimbrial biogenesis usher protein [Pantoea ananatis]RQN05298.1 fimbrial protein [Pantoea ananatis]